MNHIFTNWPENDYRYYLVHHGILKQQWGVRHGPPYPLDYNAHSKAQKKANISKHNIGQEKYSGSQGRFMDDLKRFENETRRLSSGLDRVTREVFGIPKDDGTTTWYQTSRYLADTIDKGMNGGGNPVPGPKGFDGLFDRVNPDYGAPGTTNNCPFVGAAMEIASRGYAVTARHAESGATANKFQDWFKGAKSEYNASWRELKADLLAAGDGSSGVLQGFYGDGLGSGMGGHTLHWRNENGRITVADGQCHREMPFSDVISKYHFNPGACVHTRLDNCEINWDAIASDGVLGLSASTNNPKALIRTDDSEFRLYKGY